MAGIQVPDPPAITGLTFRGFAGPADFPAMVSVIEASKAIDRLQRTDSIAEMARIYSNLTNSDPSTDMLFAEVKGRVAGYTRVMWWDEVEDLRRYWAFGFVRPEFRRYGLGTAMLRWNERRIASIAAGHPASIPKFVQVIASDTEPGAAALYLAEGYQPFVHDADMVRPHLDDIPELPLPAGLALRTPEPAEMRKVWDADREAFRDHPEASDNYTTFDKWLTEPNRDPSLWRVAWAGDEIAGQVHTYIDAAENAEYQRRRGYTEEISVRRAWRRQGLARALLCSSLRALRERGMEEAALGVMIDNPTGAVQLYESLGFAIVKRYTSYQKPVET